MRTQDEKHIKNFLTRVTVATYSANIIGKRSELEKGIMDIIRDLNLDTRKKTRKSTNPYSLSKNEK